MEPMAVWLVAQCQLVPVCACSQEPMTSRFDSTTTWVTSEQGMVFSNETMSEWAVYFTEALKEERAKMGPQIEPKWTPKCVSNLV